MKKIIFSSLLCAAIFSMTSCTKEEANSAEVSSESNQLNADFVVELEGVFPKNDRFQLFYSNDTSFLEDKSIKTSVYGQSVLQKIAFGLPNGSTPQNLRLDLGSNPDNTVVSIKNIKITYKGKEVILSDEKIRDFFPDTESAVYDDVKLEYTLKPNVEGIFDPILFSSDLLKKELNKTYNSTKESK